MRVNAAVLTLILGCGKPAAEPLPPEPVAAAEADAAVDESHIRRAPEVVVAPHATVADVGVPAQVGDAMPALPPPPCDDPGLRAEDSDLNGDGRGDVRKLFAGPAMLCKLSDMDMDGDFDMAVVADAGAGRSLEYMDFDFDGRPDVLNVLDGAGARVAVLRDTDGDGIVDVVEP